MHAAAPPLPRQAVPQYLLMILSLVSAALLVAAAARRCPVQTRLSPEN
jgi:hypothetical protein